MGRQSQRRFVVEGVWSGYRSGQSRVVHRTVHTHSREKYEKLNAIRYTDGTLLYITVRDTKPRERVQEIHGYTSLIADCIKYNVKSVQELLDLENRKCTTSSSG